MNKHEKIDKPHVRIGTIGHVDHSKAELTNLMEEMLKKQFSSDDVLHNENIDETYEEENLLTLHKSNKNLK